MRVWLFGGRFPVTPSSYINPFRAVYGQIIHFYLVQFSDMLHGWFQRYYARIRTFRTPLIKSSVINTQSDDSVCFRYTSTYATILVPMSRDGSSEYCL